MSSVGGAGSAFGAIVGGVVMDMPDGGLILFRSDTVIMSFVLVAFILSQLKARHGSGARAPGLLEASCEAATSLHEVPAESARRQGTSV
mmetsp:Transcript_14074/g.25380  ORF Transcript_14074/g.25380 Transcript_14074/m.25380 type:complete len:89 (+) Transcript_14074:3-269(+)